MAPEQDWCLECGNAVSTRVVRPPGWGIPIAVALATLALLAVGVLLTVDSLSDDADRAVSGERAAAPARTAPARRPVPARRRTTTPAGAPTATPPARTQTQTVPGAVEAAGGGPVP